MSEKLAYRLAFILTVLSACFLIFALATRETVDTVKTENATLKAQIASLHAQQLTRDEFIKKLPSIKKEVEDLLALGQVAKAKEVLKANAAFDSDLGELKDRIVAFEGNAAVLQENTDIKTVDKAISHSPVYPGGRHVATTEEDESIAEDASAGEGSGEPPSPWMFQSEHDSMRNQDIPYALVHSLNSADVGAPYGSQDLTILVAHPIDGDDFVRLEFRAQFWCSESCYVSAKFDDGKVREFRTYETTGGRTGQLYIAEPTKFIEALKHSTSLTIEVPVFDHGHEQYQFDIHGFVWKPKQHAHPK